MRISRLLITLLAAVALAFAQAPAAKKADTKKAAEKKAETKAEAKKAETKAGPQIDINTATVDQLKTLDGIGEARAAAIVKNRPYQRKDQIVAKAGVPQAVYDKIKDRIIAKQAPGGEKAGTAKKAPSKK